MTNTETQSTRAGAGKTLAVPFGMVLVPIEPTMAMVNACHAVSDSEVMRRGYGRARWDAMLAAAPAVAPLTLETAEEARKDRAHAEAYYRQAEKLLTANEQTLHAEIEFVRGLLWDHFPECCGCPTEGHPGDGYFQPPDGPQCCGFPEPAKLNDAQIVASLRERFKAPAFPSPATVAAAEGSQP